MAALEGSWRPDNARNTAELVRVSPDRYEVRHPGGLVYVHQGYRAPWCSGQDPAAGRLIEIRDAGRLRLVVRHLVTLTPFGAGSL